MKLSSKIEHIALTYFRRVRNNYLAIWNLKNEDNFCQLTERYIKRKKVKRNPIQRQ